jgi:transcriptional regulator with XRE-family HTH domain
MPAKNTTPKIRKTFARNLREIRVKQGLSQEELADIAGLHRTYVGSVERGERNISIDNMERLASALKINIQDLLIDDQQPPRP